MITRDGLRLDADIYRPDAEEALPVLLMRQPYGRAIASTVVYAHPIWYASQGYIVVIQDVRGRGTSEGSFQLFANEVEDGYDAVEWAAQLPGSNGAVGMYGFSYQGMTQLYAAAAKPSALKVLAPAMVGYDLYADWAYENGALLLGAGLGWALQVAAETSRRQGNGADYRRLYQAARQLPLNDPTPARPEILCELAPESFFHDWLDHPRQDDYWRSLKPDLSGVDLPMLHVGGWFDPYLRGNVRLFQEQTACSTCLQHLWIGPWGHIPWSRRVGSVDFGPNANSPIDALQIRWFDQFLKGQDSGLAAQSPVNLFEMRANRWLAMDSWPEQSAHGFYLISTGLAGPRQDNGELRSKPPEAENQDLFVHDPWRPAPSLGGHSGMPSGSFERSAIDGRSDVLTYTTPPLQATLNIAGAMTLRLTCSADAPSFDLSAVVSVAQPSGQIFNLTQGYCRVDFPEGCLETQTVVSIPLQPTCFRLFAGDALRLSLSAAAFPGYPVNPGTGSFPATATLQEQKVITVAIHHGPHAETVLLGYSVT